MMRLFSVTLVISCLVLTITKGDDSCPGLPMCFCNKERTSVNCDGKHFTSVPDNIPENVTKLYLQYNNILELKSRTFSRYTKLEKLYLKSNKIATIESLAFGGAIYLEHIDLSGNKLAMIGRHAFAQLPNLQQLHLTTNKLESVDEHAFNGSENLRYVNLQSNSFSSIPPLGEQPKFLKLILQSNIVTNATFPSSYAHSKGLLYIGLSSNQIEILDNNTFEALGNISVASLYLSGNKLKTVEAGTFAKLASIKSLKLGRNPLNSTGLKTALQGLQGKDIVSLDISGLRLDGLLLQDTFKLLQDTTITSLDMSYNSIPFLVNGSFVGLDNLLHLDLSNCQIAKTDGMAFAGLEKLQILNIGKNKLMVVPDNLPPTLLTLFMDNNQITEVKSMVFKKQAYLQQLRIRYNKIQVLREDSFRGLLNLYQLDLKNNYIATIPGSVFDPLVRLTSLNIAQNNLAQIQNATDRFSSLGSLVYLNMADNNIFLMQRDIFKFMVSLRYLYLERNNLGALISSDFDGTLFRGLGKLTELNLMNNGIEAFAAPAFQDLTSLKLLNLTNNKMKTWDTNLFKTTKGLQYLDFTNNLISVPKKENVEGLSSLEELNLTGNPFLCGCDLRWFRDWINKTSVKVVNVETYACAEPKNWAGKPLLSFDRTKIDCMLFTRYVLIGVGCGVAILIAIAGTIMYRKRWSIKLWYYKLGTKSRQRAEDGRGDYGAINDVPLYDAYISNADDDSAWVLKNLLPGIDKGTLDGEPFGGRFSLFFEDRDAEPGQNKLKNISHHMTHSRKVIVVLSKDYLSDSFHSFEMDQAINLMYRSEIEEIIVVHIDMGLPQRKIPKVLANTMRRHQMIEWSDNHEAKELCKNELIDRLAAKADAANLDTD